MNKVFYRFKNLLTGNLDIVFLATAFIPIISFKIIARVGTPDLSKARLATITGLILALIQMTLSKKIIGRITYLEKALLGFFIIGAVWIFLLSVKIAYIFVDNSITFLYFVLFLMMVVPQLIGYDSFIHSIAKHWQPDELWNTADYKTINLRSTYVFGLIMLVACFSTWLGDGKPLFSILIPLILIKFIGIPFVRRYPTYYIRIKKADTA